VLEYWSLRIAVDRYTETPLRLDSTSSNRDSTEEALFALACDQETEHALVFLDAQQRVVGWRGAATKLFGYSAEEMHGATLERLFTPEDRARGEIANEYKTALSYGRADDDRWLVRKDNVRIWVSGVMTVLRRANGRLAGFSKIFRDRTEVRGQLETLRNRLDAALQSDNRKNIFIATLAHELRNPLGPLANAAHIIRRSSVDKTEIACPVTIIERQVHFIERLVSDMLDVTRVDTGKINLNLATVELRQVIGAAIETCSTQLEDKRQTIEVLMPASISLEADAIRLQQVLINLIGNASKFSPTASKIWIKATVEGDEAVVRVEDRGRGIPGELLPHIFELFTQARAPSRDHASNSGLGLGLTLVKSFVELHHGTVQARSEGVGKGAEITVRVPLKQRELGAFPDAHEEPFAGP
jgi:PAS domain S-box-containing protein